MKFNTWSMKRIKEGTKTLTSRKTKHEYDIEVVCIVGPLPWDFIKKYLYRDEGASSPEELQRIINQVQRRQVKGDDMFYVHVINPETVLFFAEGRKKMKKLAKIGLMKGDEKQ